MLIVGKRQTSILYIPLGASYVYMSWAIVAAAIRRLHDRDKRGWWLILFFAIPQILLGVAEVLINVGKAVIGNYGQMHEVLLGLSFILVMIALPLAIWGFVEIGCLAGTSGNNRFGPDPLAPKQCIPPAEDAQKAMPQL